MSDFDEYYEHFGNYSVEFPISRIASGNINLDKLSSYQASLGFRVNINTQSLTMGNNYNVYGPTGGVGENVISVGNTVIQSGQNQDVAAAASEIQPLLDRFAQTYPNITEATLVQAIQGEIKRNPTLKDRLINALKSGGIEALKAIFNHPLVSVPVETIRGFLEAGAE